MYKMPSFVVVLELSSFSAPVTVENKTDRESYALCMCVFVVYIYFLFLGSNVMIPFEGYIKVGAGVCVMVKRSAQIFPANSRVPLQNGERMYEEQLAVRCYREAHGRRNSAAIARAVFSPYNTLVRKVKASSVSRGRSVVARFDSNPARSRLIRRLVHPHTRNRHTGYLNYPINLSSEK